MNISLINMDFGQSLLLDTSHRWTPATSRHSVMVPVLYQHHAFNYIKAPSSRHLSEVETFSGPQDACYHGKFYFRGKNIYT